MAEAANQQPAPVVKPVQAKKIKIDGKKIAYFNAFALSFATFFGIALIFNAIAGFTKGKWSFGIPFSGIFLSWDISYVPNIVILAFIALAMSIFGLVTVNKITDADALKKAWCANAKVFMVLTTGYVVAAIATCVYSLMYIKDGAGPTQKALWLNGFIPTLVMGGVSFGIAAISKAIAGGKTALVRVMSYIALTVASIAFILMFVQQLVSIHGKKSSSSYDFDDYSDLWDLLK
jgi:hypothetical protein